MIWLLLAPEAWFWRVTGTIVGTIFVIAMRRSDTSLTFGSQSRAMSVECPFYMLECHGRRMQDEAVDADPASGLRDTRLREAKAVRELVASRTGNETNQPSFANAFAPIVRLTMVQRRSRMMGVGVAQRRHGRHDWSGRMAKVNATLRCPHCGDQVQVVMPTDRCLVAYDCLACARTLRPKAGDCCVFCSYADRPCPPVQDSESSS